MAKLLPAAWAIPQAIRVRLGKEAGRQRAMFHEGHLLLVTHALPDPRHPGRQAAFFWRAPDGAWKAAGQASGAFGGLVALVESYRAAVAALEAKLDGAGRAAEFHEVVHAVAPVLRSARNLHRTLQEAREAVAADAGIIVVRDLAYEVERAAELVATEAKAGLDFVVAERAEAQAAHAAHIARSNHRLNLVVATFLPVTALGGMLGMNLSHGLEGVGRPWLFWGAVAASFAVGFVLRASIDRKAS